MRMLKVKTWVSVVALTATLLMGAILPMANVGAADSDTYGFTMSPLKENVILNPGDKYQSSFIIHNPATNQKNFDYELSVTPFYVDENYKNIFTAVGNYSDMTEWITIDSDTTGTLAPNEQQEIHFTINVPKNAMSGGQYATVTVSSAKATNEGDKSAILEKTAIAHTIFAEVTGTSVHSGDITDATVPSFMFSGNIYGESTIKNTGNVHGKATYTIVVTPLFSSEEAYTNAENPTTHDILPDRSYYNKIEWDKTPAVGMFNVKYTVDFDGITKEVSKLVIICPIWLIILIGVIIVAIIVGIVALTKKKKQ